ncbi:MAG: hypothetical protein ACOZAL_03030 [Patescibacteria group bacterium]
MKNFIKKIQQKPRSSRLLILWLSTILVMLIIIAIWLFSFSRSLKSERASKEIKETNLPSLFETLKRDFSSFKQELEASFKNMEINE